MAAEIHDTKKPPLTNTVASITSSCTVPPNSMSGRLCRRQVEVVSVRAPQNLPLAHQPPDMCSAELAGVHHWQTKKKATQTSDLGQHFNDSSTTSPATNASWRSSVHCRTRTYFPVLHRNMCAPSYTVPFVCACSFSSILTECYLPTLLRKPPNQRVLA